MMSADRDRLKSWGISPPQSRRLYTLLQRHEAPAHNFDSWQRAHLGEVCHLQNVGVSEKRGTWDLRLWCGSDQSWL